MICFGKYSWRVTVFFIKSDKCVLSDMSSFLGCIFRESVEGRYVPNAGFLEDAVFEDPSLLSTCQISDSTEGASETSNNAERNEGEESLDINDLQSNSSSALKASNDDENDAANKISVGVGDLKLQEAGSANEANDQHSFSTADVDSLLDKCLLQALHTTVKDKDLPMPGSTLWWDTAIFILSLSLSLLAGC